MSKFRAVSSNPSDFVDSTPGLDNYWGTIEDYRVVVRAFSDKSKPEEPKKYSLAVELKIVPDDPDLGTNKFWPSYGAGAYGFGEKGEKGYLVPGKNGEPLYGEERQPPAFNELTDEEQSDESTHWGDSILIASDDTRGILKSTNWAKLSATLETMGVSGTSLQGMEIIGIRGHWLKVPNIQDSKKTPDPNAKVPMILLPTEVDPASLGKLRGKSGSVTTSSGAQATGALDVKKELTVFIQELLSKATAPIKTMFVFTSTATHKVLKGHLAEVRALTTGANSAEFLTQGMGDGLWLFDADNKTLAPLG